MGLVWANLAQVVLCMGLAFLIFALLEAPVRRLLDELTGLPAATMFFTRVLVLLVLLAGLRRAVVFINKPNDAWGHIWTVMSNWNEVMEPLSGALMVFAVLMTVLVAVLRHGHER